jgi:hypothetical protein
VIEEPAKSQPTEAEALDWLYGGPPSSRSKDPMSFGDEEPEPRAAPPEPHYTPDGYTSLSRPLTEAERASIEAEPDPEPAWEPGDLAKGIWDRALGRYINFLCDPATGELAHDDDGNAVPASVLADEIADARHAREAEEAAAEVAATQAARLERARSGFGVRCLIDIPAPGRPLDLLLGRLDAEEDSVLFGDGGARKGTLACSWIVGLATAGHRILVVDYENHEGEWRRRIGKMGGTAALERVHHVAPTGSLWEGPRGAIWNQTAALREVAEAVGATYLVIDSAVAACGATDPSKPEAPAQYFPALRFIGRPTLTIAHQTRVDGGKHPFGSVFWHNFARVTWHLAKTKDGSLLTQRKDNNHQLQGRYLVTFTYHDGTPAEAWENRYAEKLADLIAEALSEAPAGGWSLAEVVDRINADVDDVEQAHKEDSVRKALERGSKTRPDALFRVAGEGRNARWTNAG